MYRHPSSHQKRPRTLCSHGFFGPLSFGMVRNSIQVAACWLCVRSVKSVSSPPLHANPGKSRMRSWVHTSNNMIPCRQQKQDVLGTFDTMKHVYKNRNHQKLRGNTNFN